MNVHDDGMEWQESEHKQHLASRPMERKNSKTNWPICQQVRNRLSMHICTPVEAERVVTWNTCGQTGVSHNNNSHDNLPN
eukprot:scaffold46717_cov321-Amphora_coffeaeformis.AAC.1